ncbi:MAG TPA: DUF2125 domain-containing protein [Caulobacteraceae bacterium]|jgi:hypothetical protein|nr:DUF2125 domain-containing protein [Caulobacteraceae bacterium]
MTRRLGLYGPFIALAIAAAAGTVGWLWLKSATERRLDALAARAARGGGAFTWASRRVGGFPFRLDVDFDSVTWRDASGWGVSVPVLKTEASVFAPGHWVAVAPAGAVLLRPAGSVKVSAKVLRASLFDMDRRPASFSLEGIGLSFVPVPGAAPYFLSSAGEVHMHTRPGPTDQGAALIEFDRATPVGGPLGAVSGGKPVSLVADGIWDHAHALAGPSWGDAGRSWSAAGGRIEVRRLRLTTTGPALEARGAGLGVDGDGRLEGVLSGHITQAPQVLTELAAAGIIAPDAARTAATAVTALGPAAPVTIEFQAGRMTLGPVALAPAPKVY